MRPKPTGVLSQCAKGESDTARYSRNLLAMCAMLMDVRALMSMVRRNRFHSGIAALACSLVLVFAVGAKVAWYHTADQSAKPIASAKMWQMSKVSSVEDVKISTAGEPVLFLLLVQLLVIADVLLLGHSDLSLPASPHALFPPIAVRPPPSR